jgi:hypothetical protein
MYITRVSPFGDHGVTSNARPTSVPNATSHTRPYGFQVSEYATNRDLLFYCADNLASECILDLGTPSVIQAVTSCKGYETLSLGGPK